MGWMKGMRGIISLSNWKEGTVIYQDGEDCKRTILPGGDAVWKGSAEGVAGAGGVGPGIESHPGPGELLTEAPSCLLLGSL